MKPEQIVEGGSRALHSFCQDEMIVDSDSRAGGRLTDCVEDGAGLGRGEVS